MGDSKPGYLIYVDKLEEGMQGVFVRSENFTIPFLFPISPTEDNQLDLFDEKQYSRIEPEIKMALADWGELAGKASNVVGYPVISSTSNMNHEYVVEYRGLRFRLFNLLVISQDTIIPCYVPYNEAMFYMDEWLSRHQQYQMAELETEPSALPLTSCGQHVLH